MIRELGKRLAGKFLMAAFNTYQRLDRALDSLDELSSRPSRTNSGTRPSLFGTQKDKAQVPIVAFHGVAERIFNLRYGHRDTVETAQKWRELARILDSAAADQEHIKSHCALLSDTLRQIANIVGATPNNKTEIEIPMNLINTLGQRLHGFEDAAIAWQRKIDREIEEKNANVLFMKKEFKIQFTPLESYQISLLEKASEIFRYHFGGFWPAQIAPQQLRSGPRLVVCNDAEVTNE